MATLTRHGARYLWRGRFDERSVPEEAGFRWDTKLKHWFTLAPAKAARLIHLATPETAAYIREACALEEAALAASRATDAAIQIPAPMGCEYLPYQKAGIAYALGKANVLIGDEMGLGKTLQAIGVINADESIRSVLVFCPASLKINWSRELRKWLTRPLSIGIAEGKTGIPDTDIVIINYDIAARFRDELMRRDWDWDMQVLDEVHYLKNPESQRAQAVLGRPGNKKRGEEPIPPIPARRVVALSGTPIPNRPVEIWPILARLAPREFGNFWAFAKRYCGARDTGAGWDFSGNSNLEELQERMRKTVLIRRLKADVLKDLPPKRRQVVELPADGTGVKAREKRAWGDAYKRIMGLSGKAEAASRAGDEAAYQEAIEALAKNAFVDFDRMSEIRRETGEAKVERAARFIADALADSPKIVVFAHHRSVVEGLRFELENRDHACVTLTGQDSMKARDHAVQAFQNNPEVRVFIGNIQAAGVGLTLTAASHVIFVELDWVPGNVTQAEDRCHRIGQKDSVLVQHLVLEGSIDAIMAKVLIHKQKVIEQALDLESSLAEPALA